MLTTLTDTTSSEILSTLRGLHRQTGMPSGLIHTLITVVDPTRAMSGFEASMEAARQFPCRVIVWIAGRGDGDTMDAEIHSGDATPGDVIVIRTRGQVSRHIRSVVEPLTLPDSPIICWWPTLSEAVWDGGALADHQLGSLASSRIVDSATATDPIAALHALAATMSDGDMDLAWTRLTRWRALLATALDYHPLTLESCEISSPENNPSAVLLAAWLRTQLAIPVTLTTSEGPGITAVRCATSEGELSITRADGETAVYSVPGEPSRTVALSRSTRVQLLGEELRRHEPDTFFEHIAATVNA